MARPRKADAPDTTKPCDLTIGAIERLVCPPDKAQTFLRDSKVPGLRVRVTSNGAKSFVFERKLHRETVRRTIGDVSTWTIETARVEARRLGVLLDQDQDPRELDRQKAAERAAHAAAEVANALTVREAWGRYTEERRPRWSERHYADHLKITQDGGQDRKRCVGVKTKPGPLAPLMPLRLVDLTTTVVERWVQEEVTERPARVRLGLRLLKAFLRWVEEQPDLKGRTDSAAASSKRARESAGKAKIKNDCLQREQLAPWFKHVRSIPNPVIAAYLQTLLLTGRRREHVMALRWEDVNFQWKTISMKDKVEDGLVVVPLTPYVAHLLSELPHRNEWVFSSIRTISSDEKNRQRRERYHSRRGQEAPTGDISTASASGRLINPFDAHQRACAAAGLTGLSFHGLRRSFGTLCEWLDVPAGVSAQIQGHAPSGVRERHYIRRPVDLLRVHHERIEAWIIEQAGIEYEPSAVIGHLRSVA